MKKVKSVSFVLAGWISVCPLLAGASNVASGHFENPSSEESLESFPGANYLTFMLAFFSSEVEKDLNASVKTSDREGELINDSRDTIDETRLLSSLSTFGKKILTGSMPNYDELLEYVDGNASKNDFLKILFLCKELLQESHDRTQDMHKDLVNWIIENFPEEGIDRNDILNLTDLELADVQSFAIKKSFESLLTYYPRNELSKLYALIPKKVAWKALDSLGIKLPREIISLLTLNEDNPINLKLLREQH
jgi:hypothetical protein